MEFLTALPWTYTQVPEYALFAFAALVFAGAGIVKGTLGVGMPLFAVPLLVLVLPAPTAISLLAVPVLCSNLWQAARAAEPVRQFTRFRWLSLALLVSTVLSVRLALALPLDLLNLLVALSVICAVILMLYRPDKAIPRSKETPLGILVGVLAGAMGGLSSLTGPFIITYLLALRLPREEFVGSISLIYLFGVIPLYASLAYHGRLGWAEAAVSLLAVVPMAMGMSLGRRLRTRLSEVAFRRILLAFLASVAVLLIAKSA